MGSAEMLPVLPMYLWVPVSLGLGDTLSEMEMGRG